MIARTGDGHVGETRFGIVDGTGHLVTVVVSLVAVPGWGEVTADLHTRPFTALGFVRCGDGHVGRGFIIEPVNGGEDGAGAMGVDEVDQRLKVMASRVMFGVVLQGTPGSEQNQLGVGGAAACFEVVGRAGQCTQRVPGL